MKKNKQFFVSTTGRIREFELDNTDPEYKEEDDYELDNRIAQTMPMKEALDIVIDFADDAIGEENEDYRQQSKYEAALIVVRKLRNMLFGYNRTDLDNQATEIFEDMIDECSKDDNDEEDESGR